MGGGGKMIKSQTILLKRKRKVGGIKIILKKKRTDVGSSSRISFEFPI